MIARRQLGKGGPMVSAIGLGCMSLSGVYGEADDAESVALVHHALDRGVNHLDSSDMYGWGQNETLLGRALKGRRDQVFLATKFGQTRQEGGQNGVDGSGKVQGRFVSRGIRPKFSERLVASGVNLEQSLFAPMGA